MPTFEACPYIRQVVDTIDVTEESVKILDERGKHDEESRPRIVLEWMETDLWNYRPYGKAVNPILVKTIAKSVLEALVVFQNAEAVHTGKISPPYRNSSKLEPSNSSPDINPNNVLLSNMDEEPPIVKLGDLDQGA